MTLENYADVLAVLHGRRIPLDVATWQIASFMLVDRGGCDAEITRSAFTLSWRRGELHAYARWCAPGVVSFLLQGATFPATRHLTRRLGPMTIPATVRYPMLQFDARYVRIASLDASVAIRVRDSEADLDHELAPVPPLPDPPTGHRCPHCVQVPERYRVLSDGTLVCLACGRSSPSPV